MNSISKKAQNIDVSEWKSPQLSNNDVETEIKQSADDSNQKEVYEKAYKKGYDAGMALSIQEMTDRLETLDNMLKALSRPFDDQSQELAEYISFLAGRIAKSLVRRELQTEPAILMTLVRDTVSALYSNHQEVCIHLNPQNAELIRGLINKDSEEQSWKIIEDPLVSYNDCKVSSQDSIIDADLDTRIDLIITQLLDDERNGRRE